MALLCRSISQDIQTDIKAVSYTHLPHGVGKFADLQKSGANAQIETDAEDTDHCRNAPDKVIDCTVDCFDGI